jgi:hypothetical protein
VRLYALAMVVGLLFTQAAPSARAQSPGQAPADQGPLVRQALASAYGKALSTEFGKSLRANADPACLNSRGIPGDELESRGRELVIKWGARMLEGAASVIDPKAYADKFAAGAELEGLKQNVVVERYLAIAQPMRLAKVLDSIFEQFDRYALISRIKLTPVSPLATGNSDLLGKNPTEATEQELQKFVRKNARSAALHRFLELSEQAEAARSASLRKEAIPGGGAPGFFRGVEADLAELCIRSAR